MLFISVPLDNLEPKWMQMNHQLNYPRRSHFSLMIPPLCGERNTVITKPYTTTASSTTSDHIQTTEVTKTTLSAISTSYPETSILNTITSTKIETSTLK